ncbi:NADPH-dependent FMN reductase [Allosalinactinospora lopnorensis]|uniref:NADPH-dependent FMN reductase n=1 Tax=Allosalinactinospora lopnorensis TaxID=1352348 RepID=UPI00069781D5|nr:NAD(P)H-dependent oxidoreductase [Allosalinactinospora lopnorensis]
MNDRTSDRLTIGDPPGENGRRPFVLGLGGTVREGSSSERVLRFALRCAEQEGAHTGILSAAELDIPMYAPGRSERDLRAHRLVRAVAAADGIIIASPGYHGGISGLIKNALDYIEDLRENPRPYLDGRAVGCVVCASGPQAAATTLVSLRSVVHALRGWPTPLGVAINSAETSIDDPDNDRHPHADLRVLARQVVDFAASRPGIPLRRPQRDRAAEG